MMLQTKHQGSTPCGFRQEDFFIFLTIKAYVKHVTPGPGHGAGPFLATGTYRKMEYFRVAKFSCLCLKKHEDKYSRFLIFAVYCTREN